MLLLPPLFKWWCRCKCDWFLIGLVSGGTCVSALFQSAQKLPGSSLPGDGSELPVCSVTSRQNGSVRVPLRGQVRAGCPVAFSGP